MGGGLGKSEQLTVERRRASNHGADDHDAGTKAENKPGWERECIQSENSILLLMYSTVFPYRDLHRGFATKRAD